MEVDTYAIYKKGVTESELIAIREQCDVRMEELKHTTVALFNDRTLNALRSEYNHLVGARKQINQKLGVWVEPEIWNDADDPYGTFKPKVTYTLGQCIINGLRGVIPERYSDDGAYGYDAWLTALGVVTDDIKSDHESGGLYYYFPSEEKALEFIGAINAKMVELRKMGMI
jgi:hypothetical protein